MSRLVRAVSGAIFSLCVVSGHGYAESRFGAQSTADSAGREFWLVPSQVPTPMRAVLYRPPGRGPFPLAIINHGSTQNAEERARIQTPYFAPVANYLLARGYAVLSPQRPGHGETGGPYLEGQGRCVEANFAKAGFATADSIATAIDYMRKQDFIRPDPVLLVGQSAGGWGVLALASRNSHAIKAAIVFAPGRGGRVDGQANKNCAPDLLAQTAGMFGKTARIPVLWLSTQNDSFFAPGVVKPMVDAYKRAGGNAEYHLLPASGEDGHRMITDRAAAAVWGPLADAFLARLR